MRDFLGEKVCKWRPGASLREVSGSGDDGSMAFGHRWQLYM